MRIAVIGLGRIGGQLLREVATKYLDTIGVDLDPARVGAMKRDGFNAGTDPADAAGADVYLIAVSTGPRMENLLTAVQSIEPAAGALVSVESTIPPGTMARLAAVFKARGRTAGEDIFLVHAPHRILFGADQSIFGQTRVIGGITPACLRRGLDFYTGLVPELIPCSDVRLAELTKIVENSLRHVEISCAEALALYCRENGLDFDELRRAVNSKGNVRLLDVDYGIGGECLPKDIKFLYETTGCQLLADALAVDEEYRSRLAREAKAPAVLIRGLTFKPGWRDLGYSRAVELARRLEAAGCLVYVEDPLYSAAELAEAGFTPWRGEKVDVAVNRGRISKGGC